MYYESPRVAWEYLMCTFFSSTACGCGYTTRATHGQRTEPKDEMESRWQSIHPPAYAVGGVGCAGGRKCGRSSVQTRVQCPLADTEVRPPCPQVIFVSRQVPNIISVRMPSQLERPDRYLLYVLYRLYFEKVQTRQRSVTLGMICLQIHFVRCNLKSNSRSGFFCTSSAGVGSGQTDKVVFVLQYFLPK